MIGEVRPPASLALESATVNVCRRTDHAGPARPGPDRASSESAQPLTVSATARQCNSCSVAVVISPAAESAIKTASITSRRRPH